MGKLKNYKWQFLSLVLMVIGVLIGADVAMADTLTVSTDTTEGGKDSRGLKSDLGGSAASGSNLMDASDIVEPEIDTEIVKFRPYKFPLQTDVVNEARKRTVKNYEQKHYVVGVSRLDSELTAKITGSSTVKQVTLTIDGDDKQAFRKHDTIDCEGVWGYDITGQTQTPGKTLMLYVVGTSSTGMPIVIAINGPKATSTDMQCYVPTLEIGTKIKNLGNAGYETQMIVAPENFAPQANTVYLQKRLVNTIITDYFKSMETDIPFAEQDIAEHALYNFRRKCCRSYWNGKSSKFKVFVNDELGDQYVYTSEGILPQIRRSYSFGDKVGYNDLIALAKMQFTDESCSDTAEVYCGKNAIERLLNIDYTLHKDVSFKKTDKWGINCHSFECNFGTLNFKYDPTLDDIGYQDFMIVLDIKNAIYYKISQREDSIDMKKSEGQEATRNAIRLIDCIGLRGYNSIIAGPADMIGNYAKGKTGVTSAAALPTTGLTEGMQIFLTAADGGFNANTLVIYKNGSWKEFEGEI